MSSIQTKSVRLRRPEKKGLRRPELARLKVGEGGKEKRIDISSWAGRELHCHPKPGGNGRRIAEKNSGRPCHKAQKVPGGLKPRRKTLRRV